jgi:hypothetical protein
MREVPLYRPDGVRVTTVLMPPVGPPPEVLIWGARFFAWRPEVGAYVEARALQVFDRAEHEAMRKEGILT